MKTIISIIALLFGLSLSAQTFERTIALSGHESAPYNLVEVDGFYYVLVYQVDDSLSVLYQLDSLGGTQDSLSLNGHYSHLYYLNNNLYLFGGFGGPLIAIGGAISIASISPFNLTLQSVTYTKITDLQSFWPGEVGFFDNCTCFTIVGGGTDSSGYARASIIQLDTATLNVIKEAHSTNWTGPVLNTSGATAFRFKDVIYSPNNNLWVLADSPVDTGWQSQRAAIIPFSDRDLTPDTINFRYLFDVNNPSPFANIDYHGIISNQPASGIQLTDSTYLFVGIADVFSGNLQTAFWLERDIAFVITDDSLNDIRWEFWGGKAGGLPHTSPDSTEYPAFGRAVSKYGNYAYMAYNSTAFGSTNPFTLRKIDLQGNEIWTKLYSVSQYPSHTYSVLATSDGGALLSGIVFDINLNNGTSSNNVHLLKVDSAGNLLTTSTKSQLGKIPKNNFKIFPNPVKDELKLLKLNQFKPYEFELYDTFGRLVKTVSWREDHQTVDVSSLASGMYVYRIIDEEGNVGSGKLIME
ncbi:MAG: hypothetical protein CMC96_10825 [Flavobacteriales bacterium]|nr:hypothetical protein [Flavobacteriales bacterium]